MIIDQGHELKRFFDGPILSVNSIIDITGFKVVCSPVTTFFYCEYRAIAACSGGGSKLFSQFDQESFETVAHFVEITKIANKTNMLLLSMPLSFWSGCPHETFSCNKVERILKRYEQS